MRILSYLSLLLALSSYGCNARVDGNSPSNSSAAGENIVLLNVTSDPAEDPQSVDMAMKLAGFALDEGRRVAMFFNVRGVKLPTKEFDASFAFQDNDSLIEQLNDLIARGAEVHVCPICMKAWDVADADIIDGAQVTTRPKLFANIGPDTAVFTY